MRYTSLIFLCIAAMLFLLCVMSIANASTIPGYTVAKSHSLVGSPDGDLFDYPVKIIVHRWTWIDNGPGVGLKGSALSWPNDIRFTDANGTLLSYWIESYNDTVATIWVRVSYIPAAPNRTTINLYYGKAFETSASNGSTTFPLFDDFAGSSFNTSEWTKILGSGSNITQQNGELDFYGGGSNSERPLIRSNTQFGRGIMITATTKTYTAVTDYGAIISLATCWDGNTGGPWMGPNNAYTYEYNANGANAVSLIKQVSGSDLIINQSPMTADTNWHTMSLGIDKNGNLRTWLDGTLKNTASDTTYTGGYVSVFGREQPSSIEEGVKTVYVRNYTINEPQYGTWKYIQP